ncbi:SurA N-terminal domain-containing protein [Nocardioides sp. zg-1228]|uniref:SurA N-terminal domain-containing protein n=1 Tax=Nocardioides sp. zg-1228 TaxID=2763008 RepID=UPI001642609B|nr:SurA N-terminal domain-containing protein [Nocardioides sp. zg-1228]MBC2932561.1 SurA N-terminal domain-containing protein [Nocardioides sp. zg-1228]QSF58058.1 SurA N-terminal domain-containing protein [Nocardioides sp. zg-1228]
MTSSVFSLMTSRTRTVIGALSVAAVLTLSACGGSDASDDAKDSSSSSSPSASASDGAAEGPQPDLDAIPDVVAEVNGEQVTKEEFVPIYKAAFQQAAAQAQMTGEEPDEKALRKQTADNLVDTELLLQEAESRGLEVSDEAVDEELADLAKQNGMGSADELLEAVEAQGLSAEQAREQVETQAMVEQLVADEDGPLEPTDKELRKIYAQAKKQQAASGGGQEIPPFDQVRDQLVEQAEAQQVGKVATELVTDLRKDADITINL